MAQREMRRSKKKFWSYSLSIILDIFY